MAARPAQHRFLLNIFYFVGLFIALTLIGFCVAVASGIAQRIGTDGAKGATVLGSLSVATAVFRVWIGRRKVR